MCSGGRGEPGSSSAHPQFTKLCLPQRGQEENAKQPIMFAIL